MDPCPSRRNRTHRQPLALGGSPSAPSLRFFKNPLTAVPRRNRTHRQSLGGSPYALPTSLRVLQGPSEVPRTDLPVPLQRQLCHFQAASHTPLGSVYPR